MAKRNPPSPTPPSKTDKRGLADEGTQEGAQYPSEHEQHALTHEDGDAETHGAPMPTSDDAGTLQPHDDYAGIGRDASGSVPVVRGPSQSQRVDWPEGTVGVDPIDAADAVKRNAKARNVKNIEGEAGQAAGSRGRSSGRSDESADVEADGAIHDAIRKSLSDAIDLDVSHVEVTVTSGLVLLTGYVPERWMQHVVQTEVEKVDGVKGVDNRLHERRVKAMSHPGESQEGHKI
ncbi:transport-associated protein [Pandoraea anapnoica]|uniref:Transport-associated protein n=1 Tax=Pandoraea anapnoica TaxID=2508301 RepID=A0A5E4ZZB0_9BURK|nr:BON domain-containing protein [Pandoraea anapnoica]VVE65615.1 transport-associated protein [Pandoraea anapnoica]